MRITKLKHASWEEEQLSSHEVNNCRRIIISDCDGILTDGNLTCTKDGKFAKTYGCHDKEMVRLMAKLGYEFLFVTNDKSGYDITNTRIKESLGLGCVIANGEERRQLVESYKKNGYEVIFCGDSPSDLSAVSICDYACTVRNCFYPIKMYFDYVAECEGGHGGFAEILYHIMYMKNLKTTK